jgi:glyoxylase I family protein
VPPAAWLHHVALTVTDLERSTDWYRNLLGSAEVLPRDGATWRRVLLRTPTMALSLTTHDGTEPDDRFDERRVGIDHLAVGCRERTDLDAWVAHLDALGVRHGPITEAPHAHLVACHDPDGIAVEFYWLAG